MLQRVCSNLMKVMLQMKITGFKFFKTEDPASVTEEQRRLAFDIGAETYDEEVCSGEWMMGITKLRKRLLALADGEVLEVAAGFTMARCAFPSRSFESPPVPCLVAQRQALAPAHPPNNEGEAVRRNGAQLPSVSGAVPNHGHRQQSKRAGGLSKRRMPLSAPCKTPNPKAMNHSLSST